MPVRERIRDPRINGRTLLSAIECGSRVHRLGEQCLRDRKVSFLSMRGGKRTQCTGPQLRVADETNRLKRDAQRLLHACIIVRL